MFSYKTNTGAIFVAGILELNSRFYKRKGAALSDDELNSIFDGGDIYVGTIGDLDSQFLIHSYRYGGTSCLQRAVCLFHEYRTFVRKTSQNEGGWSNWVEV